MPQGLQLSKVTSQVGHSKHLSIFLLGAKNQGKDSLGRKVKFLTTQNENFVLPFDDN